MFDNLLQPAKAVQILKHSLLKKKYFLLSDLKDLSVVRFLTYV